MEDTSYPQLPSSNLSLPLPRRSILEHRKRRNERCQESDSASGWTGWWEHEGQRKLAGLLFCDSFLL